MTPVELLAELRVIADHHGLAGLGVARAEPLLRARHALVSRKAAGLHDGMQFTYKNPERSTDPERSVAGARSIVVGALDYLRDTPAPPAGLSARVARYARSDHYAPLRAALQECAGLLRNEGFRAVAFADDNSVVDREVAYRAGIGWFGKNANILLPGRGSWFVLGSVITTAELPVAAAPVDDGCGTCRRCFDGCPTGAIVDAGVIDARRCLAWLVQKPGIFPIEYRRALGDRLYGCDDCQDVCPINRRHAIAGSSADGETAWVPVLELLAMSDAAIIERYGRWYLHDREPRWLRRNALIVLGNTGDGTDPAVQQALEHHLAHPDPILRAHAVWAARALDRADLVPDTDPDPLVRAECSAP